MLEEIYKMLGYDDTVFDTEGKAYEAHQKLIGLLSMCEDLGIVSKVNEDNLDRIENSDL